MLSAQIDNSPNTSSTMKAVFAALVALFSVASALELTPANFEAEVKGEKNAFVKFQAPWCEPHARPTHRTGSPSPLPKLSGVGLGR